MYSVGINIVKFVSVAICQYMFVWRLQFICGVVGFGCFCFPCVVKVGNVDECLKYIGG